MKAIIYTRYGAPDALQLVEADKPVPGDNEVLVKVHAVSINAADWHRLTADVAFIRLMGNGFFKPNNPRIGSDVAGVVETAGKGVKQFKAGDEVYADVFESGTGSLAEYVCIPEGVLAPKPANLSFEEAACVPLAAVTALKGLRDVGQIQSGQKALIYGASGGVGTFAVQVAKALGAEVSAVCSTGKMDMVCSIGADKVIDYTREDFTQNGERYDLIFAANGYRSIFDYSRSLAPTGAYVVAGGKMRQLMQAMLLGPALSKEGGKKFQVISSHPDQKCLFDLKELIEAGKIKPVIDKVYPLSQTAEAFRYFGKGHTQGKVVVVV